MQFHIPVFPVVQSKPFKEDKIRRVYDAAAKYRGVSLNDTLYQGPNLTDSFRGTLLRFCEKSVAFYAKIESIFMLSVFSVMVFGTTIGIGACTISNRSISDHRSPQGSQLGCRIGNIATKVIPC